MRNPHLPMIGAAICGVLILIGMGLSLFTFNTPTTAQVFATNTPRPPDPLKTLPDSPASEYVLRNWTEADFLGILESQITRFLRGEPDMEQAIRLTQYEFKRRFPQPVIPAEQRDTLMNLMLSAPPGVLDLRDYVRPHILDAINANIASLNTREMTTFTIDDFLIQLAPLNLNGDERSDAMIAINYPVDALRPDAVVYKDFLLVITQEDGRYLLPPMSPSIPTAPFGDIVDIDLLRLGDVNQDTVDEMVLVVDRGDINREMLIYGWRGSSVENIVLPGERLMFDEIINWSEDVPDLVVSSQSIESARWQCVGQRLEIWTYWSNFYRPSQTEPPGPYDNLSTVGCRIYENEPIFTKPTTQMIETLGGILKGPLQPQGAERGSIALAMLYLLDGQITSAETQINSLLPLAQNDPWLAGQINAFTLAASESGNNPVVVCAALVAENPDGACDVDQVLGRFFIENPVSREGDLETQLRTLGLPVVEVITVSQVGRLDRQYARFDLPGASWWAFAPTDPVFYIPTPEAPPEDEAEADADAPAMIVRLPEGIYALLTEEDNPEAVLNAIDNILQEMPEGSPLSPQAQFIQALAYDLNGNINEARAGYFALWQQYPDLIWGQLAGVHLQSRRFSLG